MHVIKNFANGTLRCWWQSTAAAPDTLHCTARQRLLGRRTDRWTLGLAAAVAVAQEHNVFVSCEAIDSCCSRGGGA